MRLALPLALAFAALSHLTACLGTDQGPDDPDLEDADGGGKADGTSTAPQVTDDQLNGIWLVKSDSSAKTSVTIDSWSAIGIQLHDGDRVIQLTRTGNSLTADGVSLTIDPKR